MESYCNRLNLTLSTDFESPSRCVFDIKGKLRSKKSLAQIKAREKCKKNEPSLTSMRQIVLETSFSLKMKSHMQSCKTLKNESAISQESFV